MFRKRIVSYLIGIALSVSGQLLLPSNGAAQPYALYTVDVPCTACPGSIALSTSAQGVNPGGDIVGWHTDDHGTHRYRLTGQLLSEGALTGGDIVTLDVPGSLMGVDEFDEIAAVLTVGLPLFNLLLSLGLGLR